jgi:hypothetical protein
MNSREGELQESWLRSDRFLQVNGAWQVRTREGRSLGPFEHREQAAGALRGYMDSLGERNERELLRRLDYILDCDGSGTPMTVAEINALLARHGNDVARACPTQQRRLAGLRNALAKRQPGQRIRVVLRTN